MKQLELIVASAFLSFLFFGCGPVNSKPESTNNTSNNSSKGTELPVSDSGDVRFTKNRAFYIFVAPKAGKNSKKEMGDNDYIFRIAQAKDLASLSSDASVTISYWMPEMPAMGKSDATATRQSDGSFLATLFISMQGH